MKREFTTTAEEDAALAWLAAVRHISEDEIIAGFAAHAVNGIVLAYRDAEASRVDQAFKAAPLDDRAAAKAALKMDGGGNELRGDLI